MIDSFNSSNLIQRQNASDCCFKLFKTKFSNYFTRNIDQMTKIVNYFLIEINDKFNDCKSIKENDLNRIYLILQKFSLCLKSQQNQNRVFILFLNSNNFSIN